MTERVTAFVEVTNTLAVPYVTGIQRTVRELITHWPADSRVVLEPVVHAGWGFRRLTDDERAVLRTEPSGVEAAVVARNGWRVVARRIPGLRRVRDVVRVAVDRRRHRARAVTITPGAILFDLEATWWSPAPRSALLPGLRGRGVAVATVIYDLLPLRRPEWFDPVNLESFVPWARAQLAHADLVLTYSEYNRAEVAHFGAPQPPATRAFIPGTDARPTEPRRPDWLTADCPFLFSLGTIEPRKNTSLLLDTAQKLWDSGVDTAVVLVGRRGWAVDDLVDRITNHPEFGRRLFWRGWEEDAVVDWLYRSAAAVTVPSWAEGYGLPVVEARRRGAVVISSNGGALPEVGDEGVVYLAPDDPEAWVAALHRVVTAPTAAHVPPDGPSVATWRSAAEQIAVLLGELAENGTARA